MADQLLTNQMGRVFCKVLADGGRLYACKNCGEFKDESEFGRYKSRFKTRNSLRLQPECKKCINAKSRAWQLANPEKFSETKWRFAGSLKGWTKNIFGRTKVNAATKGLPFELDRQWIADRLAIGVCEATGMSFDLNIDRNRWTSANSPWSPSVDRLDSRIGYLKDNCRLVIWMFNACKQQFTDEDVLRFATAVVERAAYGAGIKTA